MDLQTMVVQTHTCLPTMAESHTWVGILLGVFASSVHDALTAISEETIALALGHRDRVCRIRLVMPVPNLQNLTMTMDKECLVLEYLVVGPSKQDSTALMLPKHLIHHIDVTSSCMASPFR
jgi:hypothetical protein